MYNEHDIWSEHRIALERYHKIAAECERENVIRLIRQQQPRRAWYGRLPARLGSWLVHWGQALQARYGYESSGCAGTPEGSR
ncbi:MAG: hypothetical protein ACLFVO_00430 [Chloroflexaceae bacterium]